jgi:hypothetical protein
MITKNLKRQLSKIGINYRGKNKTSAYSVPLNKFLNYPDIYPYASYNYSHSFKEIIHWLKHVRSKKK